MKITELIAKLESIKAEHGDLRVTINTDGCDLDIYEKGHEGDTFEIEDGPYSGNNPGEEKHLNIMGYWD